MGGVISQYRDRLTLKVILETSNVFSRYSILEDLKHYRVIKICFGDL